MNDEPVIESIGLSVQPMMSNEELANAIGDASYNAAQANTELHQNAVISHLRALQQLQLKRAEMLALEDGSDNLVESNGRD